MSHKIKIRWLIGVAILGFALSTVLYYRGRKFDDVGMFLDLFSVASFIILIILYFLSEPVFDSWKKFVRVYILISIILVAMTPSSSGGMTIGFGAPDREGTTWMLAILYTVISLVIIIRAHRRLKRQETKSTPFPTGSQKSV